MNDRQVILAADMTLDAPDFALMEPIARDHLRNLERHGVSDLPETVIGDAGSSHSRQIESVTERGIEVLIPPDGRCATANGPRWENGLYELMRRKLSTERGREA